MRQFFFLTLLCVTSCRQGLALKDDERQRQGVVDGTPLAAGASACVSVQDCQLPEGIASCASAACRDGICVFEAKDSDGDGHASNRCASPEVSNAHIILGDDCDDADALRFPGAWDGPADAGGAASCDGRDQDCSGIADDGIGAGGASCTCTPGVPCAAPGWQIEQGEVGACKIGTTLCTNGVPSCPAAVGPLAPFCTTKRDFNCDGLSDDKNIVACRTSDGCAGTQCPGAECIGPGLIAAYRDDDGDGYCEKTAAPDYVCPGEGETSKLKRASQCFPWVPASGGNVAQPLPEACDSALPAAQLRACALDREKAIVAAIVDDCDDSDAATNAMVSAFFDEDSDGACDRSKNSQVCANALPSNRKLSCVGSDDCNDQNASVQTKTSVRTDGDGDGFCADDTHDECCVLGANGRCDAWRVASTCQASDCDDAQSQKHEWREGRTDADNDGRCLHDSFSLCCTAGGDCTADYPGRRAADTCYAWETCDATSDVAGVSNDVVVWGTDADGDGYCANTVRSCAQPAGLIYCREQADDCEDRPDFGGVNKQFVKTYNSSSFQCNGGDYAQCVQRSVTACVAAGQGDVNGCQGAAPGCGGGGGGGGSGKNCGNVNCKANQKCCEGSYCAASCR